MATMKNAASCCCDAPVQILESFDMGAVVCSYCGDDCDFISTVLAEDMTKPEEFPEEYFKLAAEEYRSMEEAA